MTGSSPESMHATPHDAYHAAMYTGVIRSVLEASVIIASGLTESTETSPSLRHALEESDKGIA